LKKGDFIQVENEIMLVTKVDIGNSITVKRSLFSTQAREHSINSPVKGINIIPVELRRPSILRASGHTFEYTGFGPGNYSTAMPSNQTKVLSDKQVLNSQALANRGGYVVYSGMNSNGEFFIGKKKFDASSGQEIVTTGEGDVAIVSDFDSLTLNKLTVNKEIDASTSVIKTKELQVLGISTHVGLSTFREGIWVTGIATFNNDVKISGPLTISGNTIIGNSNVGLHTVYGNLYVTQDIYAFYSPSDKNLKDNITPIYDPLAKVLSISGNTFTWKEGNSNQGDDTGVVAQEIENLGLPGIVKTQEDGHKSVQYHKIIPLLIEAIKELKSQIDELKGGK